MSEELVRGYPEPWLVKLSPIRGREVWIKTMIGYAPTEEAARELALLWHRDCQNLRLGQRVSWRIFLRGPQELLQQGDPRFLQEVPCPPWEKR